MRVRPLFSAAPRSALAAALFGFVLLAGLLLSPGAPHASAQTHKAARANSVSNTNNCSATGTGDVVIVTDGGWNVDCFSGSGWDPVGLYNVTALDTGNYDLTFTWKDYGNAYHTSTKYARAFLSAGNASASYFAGYGSINEITSITLTYDPGGIGFLSGCTVDPRLDVWMATNVPGQAYFADCFDRSLNPIQLYGVYAIETGDYTLTFGWTDYNNGTHISTIAPFTLLAAGNAGSNGFANASSIAAITWITLAF